MQIFGDLLHSHYLALPSEQRPVVISTVHFCPPDQQAAASGPRDSSADARNARGSNAPLALFVVKVALAATVAPSRSGYCLCSIIEGGRHSRSRQLISLRRSDAQIKSKKLRPANTEDQLGRRWDPKFPAGVSRGPAEIPGLFLWRIYDGDWAALHSQIDRDSKRPRMRLLIQRKYCLFMTISD